MAQQITDARIAAIVASAFNLAAADEPTLRAAYPNGMSPADAAELSTSVKAEWIEGYLGHVQAGDYAKHELLLYGVAEAQAALDWLNFLRAAR